MPHTYDENYNNIKTFQVFLLLGIFKCFPLKSECDYDYCTNALGIPGIFKFQHTMQSLDLET